MVPDVTALPQAEARRGARLCAYRSRWIIWALALLGAASGIQAATLTADVETARAGVIGRTNQASVSITGTFRDERGLSGEWTDRGYPAVAVGDVGNNAACDGVNTPGVELSPTLRRYGYSLKGPTAGAVLLVYGTGSWTRQASGPDFDLTWQQRKIQGQVTYDSGTWYATWNQAPYGSQVGLNNKPGSTNGSSTTPAGAKVNCPTVGSGTSANFHWVPGSPRSSQLTAGFVVDAPAGGLAPGRYTLGRPVYMMDSAQQMTRTAVLADDVVVTVWPPACTLNAPTDISLTTDNPATTVTISAQCTAPEINQLSHELALSIRASGQSAVGQSGDPLTLAVAGSAGNIWIRGNWSATVPDCTTSDVYFDGRRGPVLGQVAPGQTVSFDTIPISFRLCHNNQAVPGEYTAQATLAIVEP